MKRKKMIKLLMAYGIPRNGALPMTNEEMLEQLVSIREHFRSLVPKDEPDSIWAKDVDALDMALSALRTRQEDPKPLTLDELRQMDGEPVWIDDWFEDWHGWELSYDAADYLDGRNLTQYGSKWIAYRHKPKEAADEQKS